MKITVIGNSVALRVRPPEKHPFNKNYTSFISELLPNYHVENKAIGASTIIDQLKIKDDLINSFPDVYIINIGVVDSTIREVPLWFNRKVLKRTNNPFIKVIKTFYQGIIAKNRVLFSRMRCSKSWVSAKKFEREFDFLLSTLIKETNAQLITLSINPANTRIEKQLPGSKKNHLKFNTILEQVSKKHAQSFLDLGDLKSEEHYPDGVHFNGTGHKIVAERLIEIINEKQSRM